MLNTIREEFEKIKSDNNLSQQTKDVKYASLMTRMETVYHIPLLAGERFEAIDPNVKALYLELSQSRKF